MFAFVCISVHTASNFAMSQSNNVTHLNINKYVLIICVKCSKQQLAVINVILIVRVAGGRTFAHLEMYLQFDFSPTQVIQSQKIT